MVTQEPGSVRDRGHEHYNLSLDASVLVKTSSCFRTSQKRRGSAIISCKSALLSKTRSCRDYRRGGYSGSIRKVPAAAPDGRFFEAIRSGSRCVSFMTADPSAAASPPFAPAGQAHARAAVLQRCSC